MENYTRSIKYMPGTKCSVEGCESEAEYEVILYDDYKSVGEFYEQDFTCPFLCKKHLDINEKDAEGERKPRGTVSYPFTNKHLAQGYSKYNQLIEVYPQFFPLHEIDKI